MLGGAGAVGNAMVATEAALAMLAAGGGGGGGDGGEEVVARWGCEKEEEGAEADNEEAMAARVGGGDTELDTELEAWSGPTASWTPEEAGFMAALSQCCGDSGVGGNACRGMRAAGYLRVFVWLRAWKRSQA